MIINHKKYANLKAIKLDEIDFDQAETVIVRTTTRSDPPAVSITKLSRESMLLDPNATPRESTVAFTTMIAALCQPLHEDAPFVVEIVRWRDAERVWHAHHGPIERHLAIGDLVMIRPSHYVASGLRGRTGHVVRTDFNNDAVLVTVAFDDPGIPTVIAPLNAIAWPDDSSLEVSL